jgi:hypothetical protein
MLVESARPKASAAAADTSPPLSQAVDPAFEERWAAWRARGYQHERAVRRKLGFTAIALAILVVLVLVGLRFLGGSL